MPKFMLTIQAETIAELMTYLAPSGGALALASVTAPGPADDDENAPLNTSAPGLDASGLPWDGRIHAAAKSLNKDGTWRARRGVDEATVTTVTAELRGQQGAISGQVMQQVAQTFQPPQQMQPVAPVQPQFNPPPMVQPGPPAQPQFAAPPAHVFAEPQPAQTFQPPPQMQQPVAPVQPMQPQSAPMDFTSFMGGIQRGMTTTNPATGQPIIDQAYLVNFVARLSQHMGVQLNSITDIHSNPAAISVAADMLKQEGRWA